MTSTALITGASAGIGQQLAREFARNGHSLVLVARSEAPMQTLADELSSRFDIGVDVHAVDLCSEGAARRLFELLADREIDILVNNAGVLTGGAFAKMDTEAVAAMTTLNVQTLTDLCRLFVEPMVARGYGRILNVASIAAFQPIPKLAVYAATKAYVLSLSEGLSIELASRGVTVTALCPGYTDTNMLRGNIETAKTDIRVPEFSVLDPARVAADGYTACMAGDAIKVPGIGYSAASVTSRLIPKWLLRRLLGFATG